MNSRNPKLTVDGVILEKGKLLLVKRKFEPFKDKWALPGGFVEYGETVEKAIKREILEETNLTVEIKQLVGVYSDPNRDPRGHTVTIVFLLEVKDGIIESGDDASDVKFFELDSLPSLSFDHEKIINDVSRRIK